VDVLDQAATADPHLAFELHETVSGCYRRCSRCFRSVAQ